jgi:uncharacterized protein
VKLAKHTDRVDVNQCCRGLDFAPIDDSTLRDDTPILVVQHGLTGGLSYREQYFTFQTDKYTGSYEPYLKAIVARVVEPPERGGLGYRAIVVHFRGCVCVLLYPRGVDRNFTV